MKFSKWSWSHWWETYRDGTTYQLQISLPQLLRDRQYSTAGKGWTRIRIFYVDVGINGRNSDGRIWRQYSLKDALEKNKLDIPDPTPLRSRENKVPYFCTGDDAFPFPTNMMKLFPQINLTKERRVFKCRLGRKRQISKNDFGILANRWRVFRLTFALEPE